MRDNDSNNSKPGAVVVSAKSTVPQVVGIREQAAKFQLQQAKLATHVVDASCREAARHRRRAGAEGRRLGAAGDARHARRLDGRAGRRSYPSLVGLAAADAAKQLTDLKLAAVLKQVASKEAPGTVIAQKPAAGVRAKPGSQGRARRREGEAERRRPERRRPDAAGRDRDPEAGGL